VIALSLVGCSGDAAEGKDMHLDAPVSKKKESTVEAGLARGDSAEETAKMAEPPHRGPGSR